MFNLDFCLDGVSAKSKGISLQGPILFSGIEPIVEAIHVPGRNGDLVFDTGAYSNRTGEANCFALKSNVQAAVDSATDFLLGKSGYRRLECSNDPGHFWLARAANGARIENRLNLLNPFEIKFDCKPQRFRTDGEEPITYSASPITLQNPGSGKSLPLIVAKGSENGNVTVNGTELVIKSIAESITIDCELGEVYTITNESASKNVFIPEYPSLVPGKNEITFSGGITEIIITPRWWDK